MFGLSDAADVVLDAAEAAGLETVESSLSVVRPDEAVDVAEVSVLMVDSIEEGKLDWSPFGFLVLPSQAETDAHDSSK